MLSGIDNQIWQILTERHNLSADYELREMNDLIENFLNEGMPYKRIKLAQKISKRALRRHGKIKLHPFLSSMVNIERGVQQFNTRLRDHISHSVYVYLLGLAFMEKYTYFREIDPLSWKIAALLHDIGYPPEWFAYATRKYLDSVCKASGISLTDNRRINCSLSINNIQTLEFCGTNTFELIDSKLGEWNILQDTHAIDMQRVFSNQLGQGKVNHGILSSLTVLKIVDHLYFKNNRLKYNERRDKDNLTWGVDSFSRQITPAVAAISIHAIISDEIDNVNLEFSPIAYLLVLCDSLQLWNRYSVRRKMYSPNDISIDFQNNPHIKLGQNVENDDFTEVEDIVGNKLLSANFSATVHRRN
jgi:hypothetical protein